MPKSVSCGTQMVELSAGGPWTSLFLQMYAKTTATTNYRPISHFGRRAQHVTAIDRTRDLDTSLLEWFLPLLAPLGAVTFVDADSRFTWLSWLVIFGAGVDEVDAEKNTHHIKTYIYKHMQIQVHLSLHKYICLCVSVILCHTLEKSYSR